jgi:AAA+ ATPase superfamily predicted ATPase
MIDTIYPEEEQRFFTDREHILALINLSREMLLQGVRKHLALSGFRRVGKTVVLKEFLRRSRLGNDPRVQVIYIDLPRLSFTPETFAVQFLGYQLYWLCGQNDQRPEAFFEPAAQLIAVGQLGQPELSAYFTRFHHELEKEKPDQHLLLEMAFNAPEIYARAMNRKVMLLLDEFPEILSLNRYPQIRDSLALFRAVLQSQSNVGYVVAGSMISLMERIFLQADSPLFVHFQMETVHPFGRSDSDTLVEKRLALLARPVPGEVLAAVYQVARGHPFYTYAVCMHVIESVSLLHKPLTAVTVQEAFTLETLGTTGRIYSLCRYFLEQSLKNVRGDTMPQAILQVIAKEPGGMGLTEIASRLKRATGALHQVLNWLQEVDLIEQREDKSYVFRDPVLQIWIAYYYSGLELTGLPNQKALSQLVTELMEKYERAANELGFAKESQVREMLQTFAGQEIPGALLGRSGSLRLPTFERVAPYLSPDGQIEVDALAEGEDPRWVVEIKWRNRQSGLREIQKLWQKAQSLQGQAWYISQAGFTVEAVAFAKENGMFFSGRAEIEALAKRVRA